MLLRGELAEEFACCFDELRVCAFKHLQRFVVYLDVRVELLVFEWLAVHVERCHLRDTEQNRRIYLRFPPYGSHCAGNGCAYQLADTERLVYVRRAVGVAVVAFVDEHDRGLVPLRERFTADVVASRRETDVFASGEEYGYVVVKPTAAVIASVNYNRIAVALQAEQLVVDCAEALAVHAVDMDVCYSSAAYRINDVAVVVNETLVEQSVLCAE